MTQFTSLRARLVGTIFVALVPAWVVMFLFTYDPPWLRFSAGLFALGAAWFGGERFIMRQVRSILRATRLLAAGDLSVRTGLDRETGELGDLARDIDQMAAALEQKARERETAEKVLMGKALQQTVVSALGQFALLSKDLDALLTQAALMVSQTLEVEYAGVLELVEDKSALCLRAGSGWKKGAAEMPPTEATSQTMLGASLNSGEPLVLKDSEEETRFGLCPFLTSHGVRSGIAVPIAAEGSAYGVLCAYTTNRRTFSEDEVHFLLAVATLLAMAVSRHRTEVEMEKLAAFARLNPNPAMEVDGRCAVTYCNDAARQLASSLGLSDPQELLPAEASRIVRQCMTTGRPLLDHETVLNRRTLAWSFHPVAGSSVVHAYIEDITDHLNLEAQLRQSQKMECVGQLAAGVAHDFNNMLTIIQGHSGLLLVKPGLEEEFRDGIQAVYFAAERAAALTRQLLMFSRKNVIQPRSLDLGEVISTTSKMLGRLLGESIRLEIQFPPDLRPVRGDTGMIEQVIMNLAVNARDAMPRGGSLFIRGGNERIDHAYVQSHPESRVGNFVRVTVQDTGCGIDPAILPRIFEPFFTTKEVGKGTGLGLATVYGIIKQHEGWIDVDTEVGQGTAFHLFFPGDPHSTPDSRAQEHVPASIPHGRETILLVEDEIVLRELAKSILSDCGYNVIEAPSGVEALKIWDGARDSVDLVLTDMMMPDGVSGMDLANSLRKSKPGIKIVFASGYSMDDLDPEFLRKGNAGFLQKPYTHVTLSHAVRECLDK